MSFSNPISNVDWKKKDKTKISILNICSLHIKYLKSKTKLYIFEGMHGY